MTAPFTPGSADFVRASNIEALGRMGLRPICTVDPVTITVRQMDESRLAILTRPGGPLTAEEWARVEGEL